VVERVVNLGPRCGWGQDGLRGSRGVKCFWGRNVKEYV
jgi:hypothetical protein